jgi:hypothetical protein
MKLANNPHRYIVVRPDGTVERLSVPRIFAVSELAHRLIHSLVFMSVAKGFSVSTPNRGTVMGPATVFVSGHNDELYAVDKEPSNEHEAMQEWTKLRNEGHLEGGLGGALEGMFGRTGRHVRRITQKDIERHQLIRGFRYQSEGIGPCPVCGEEVVIDGKTKDGRLIGTCGDSFSEKAWRAA